MAPAPELTEAEAQNAADKRFAEAVRTYKVVDKDGHKMYCRNEKASGSNILTMNCITENELRARVEEEDLYRKKSRPSMCSKGDPRCANSE